MKTRPTPETDAHKRSMEHKSFLSELAETYALAKRLEQGRDDAREAAAIVPELVTTLEACSLVLAGERLSKTFLVNALEKAQSALTKAKGQPLPNPLEFEDFAKRLEQERDEAREQAAELLEALEILVSQYNSSPDCTLGGNLTNEGFLKGRDAIAKVKGGQP